MNLKFVSSVFILSIFFLLIILIQSFTSIQSDVSSDIASNSQNSRHLLEAVKHVDSLKIKDSKLTEKKYGASHRLESAVFPNSPDPFSILHWFDPDVKDTVEDVDNFLHRIQNIEKGNLGFMHAMLAALSVIIVSELGDKTFFIAAILSMRHSRLTVFVGALSALVVMTIMSALVGYATTIIPRALTYYVSSVLFALFGVKMLMEAWSMSIDEGEHGYDECQAEIKEKEAERLQQNSACIDVESGVVRTPGRRFCIGLLSAIFLESFSLTFLAEWGDRSQIATIILGARENVAGVILGGLMGHVLCTGLAVIGGRFVAQKISMRTVTFIGGAVFLLFAVSALFFGPES